MPNIESNVKINKVTQKRIIEYANAAGYIWDRGDLYNASQEQIEKRIDEVSKKGSLNLKYTFYDPDVIPGNEKRLIEAIRSFLEAENTAMGKKELKRLDAFSKGVIDDAYCEVVISFNKNWSIKELRKHAELVWNVLVTTVDATGVVPRHKF